MKSTSKLCLVLLAVLMLFGCAGAPINIDRVGQNPGMQLNTSIGEIFFEREVMTGEDNHFGSVFYGDAQRVELVVRSATKDKLVLDYSEYMKPVAGPYGGYRKDGAWLKKPAFGKALEFDLKESKTVFFQKYEFEIIDVKSGRISYKRIN
ncbi:hypothetical protein GEOBRER4_n1626 [Citrifermentans bremense]|uniref:Uncharacterized protein n=2 Tax=Citrifermentans bremense TaxID=60035 RepID=A0A7R7FSA8_9BACT|nr:hypothetical protein [Citrifermentans bremense]BCO11327.1 hypothetical protein GEOBRER4_n1626 [Citrifermentans bremense]